MLSITSWLVTGLELLVLRLVLLVFNPETTY